MEHRKIERINELTRKQKTTGLTASEVEEQAALRKEYLDEWKENMRKVLDGVVIQHPDGTREKLKKRMN